MYCHIVFSFYWEREDIFKCLRLHVWQESNASVSDTLGLNVTLAAAACFPLLYKHWLLYQTFSNGLPNWWAVPVTFNAILSCQLILPIDITTNDLFSIFSVTHWICTQMTMSSYSGGQHSSAIECFTLWQTSNYYSRNAIIRVCFFVTEHSWHMIFDRKTNA